MNGGTEPRVQLAYGPPGDEQRIVIQVSARLGQGGGLPNIDFALSLKTDKSGQTIATVLSATPAKEIAAQLPKDFATAVGKLKGTEIRFSMTPNGAMSAPAITLSKEADPGLEIAVKGLVEVMTLTEVPLPKDPVGVGGFWMVTDRSATFGVDVVRYRVFKVQKADKDHATLAVDVRQYAVKAANNSAGSRPTSTTSSRPARAARSGPRRRSTRRGASSTSGCARRSPRATRDKWRCSRPSSPGRRPRRRRTTRARRRNSARPARLGDDRA